MNKITTDCGSWELFNNNDGNWMALPIGNPSFPTFEGSTIGSVSYQAHNWEPVKICTALEETAIRYGNSIGGNKIPDYLPKEEPKMTTNGIKSVGVRYSTANASDQEIQDFFDWCVERGADMSEAVAGIGPEVDFLYSPKLFDCFGVNKESQTFFHDDWDMYGAFVNTIEEAKDLIDPSWREGIAQLVEETARLPKTPAQKLGYKVGDKFLVKECEEVWWLIGDGVIDDFAEHITLASDDGSDCPMFQSETYGGEFYLELEYVVKIDEYKTSPIVSDGGSSPYYRFKIKSSITGEEIEVETGDVIRAMVANDFDLGNILKACRRISEAKQGRGKAGTDVAYDCNKIAYFAEQTMKAWEG